MRLPVLTEGSERTKVTRRRSVRSVTAQGCDVLCLLTKAPHCIEKCTSGNIVECIACAGTAAHDLGTPLTRARLFAPWQDSSSRC